MVRVSILMLCFLTFFIGTIAAQDFANTSRDKYYKIEELIKLIERAREAGMSEEDLKSLEIRDGDKEINVLDYIEQEKLERLKKEAALKALLEKNFLTVNDIYKELIKTEPEVIQQLREELVSER